MWLRVVFLSVLALPRAADACAVCGCGDPTITALGTEKPYRNRLRASIELKHRSDAIGRERIDQLVLSEQRLDMQLAWAAHQRLFLLLSVPVLHRDLTYVNLAHARFFNIGDIELRAKGFVWQDRAFSPRHLLAVTAGVKFPTAPLQRGLDGKTLPVELQAGTGSFDPLAGVSYAWFFAPGMLYVSANGTYPTPGRAGFQASPSLRVTSTVQYNALPWFAPRVGVDARIDGKGKEDGRFARDSGGFIAFMSFELLFTPVRDLLIFVAARVPFIQALSGFHREGTYANLGIAYDFGP
jgi:hypothetical protein